MSVKEFILIFFSLIISTYLMHHNITSENKAFIIAIVNALIYLILSKICKVFNKKD